MQKTKGQKKKTFPRETMTTGQERRQEFQLHTQEDQDFSVTAVVPHLITYKSSESRSGDLVNNGMGNHYLRDVDHGSHCLAMHRTVSFTYMSDWTSTGHLKVQRYEDTCEVPCAGKKDHEFERQPSLPGLLQDTVRVYFVRLLRR